MNEFNNLSWNIYRKMKIFRYPKLIQSRHTIIAVEDSIPKVFVGFVTNFLQIQNL